MSEEGERQRNYCNGSFSTKRPGENYNTYGLRRCEFPLRMTSTPPLPAAAMTQCLAPKSTPTTDMVLSYQFPRFGISTKKCSGPTAG